MNAINVRCISIIQPARLSHRQPGPSFSIAHPARSKLWTAFDPPTAFVGEALDWSWSPPSLSLDQDSRPPLLARRSPVYPSLEAGSASIAGSASAYCGNSSP